MKILSGLLCALFLTACSTSTSLQRHFDNNYDLALKEINAGNYATAYRKLSSYFRYNDTVPGAAERKAKIKNLFDTHPEIRSAALNTFTKDSFQQTVSKFRGKKHVASSREMGRILTFKKIYPDNYPEAAKNFTAFFGNTPEYFQAEVKKRIASLANRKDITITKKGNFISVNAKGNLEVTQPISCVDITTLSSKYTPADLFTGISDCLKKDNLDRATRLYALALAYGRYDQLRMIDKSARGAISVLQFNLLSRNDKATQQRLKKEILLHSASSKDKTKFKAMCKDIKKLGKPTYYPKYMIRHGMSVFTGGKSGVLPDFHEDENWEKIYNVFLKCPAS